jgi:hypothetical protein
MAEQTIDPQPAPAAEAGPAAGLAMPPERRRAAQAHAAQLSDTAAKVAAELPLSADVDDFRRILAAAARP